MSSEQHEFDILKLIAQAKEQDEQIRDLKQAVTYLTAASDHDLQRIKNLEENVNRAIELLKHASQVLLIHKDAINALQRAQSYAVPGKPANA